MGIPETNLCGSGVKSMKAVLRVYSEESILIGNDDYTKRKFKKDFEEGGFFVGSG